jgi:hypothetical protein
VVAVAVVAGTTVAAAEVAEYSLQLAIRSSQVLPILLQLAPAVLVVIF